jgi:hypothetical protein
MAERRSPGEAMPALVVDPVGHAGEVERFLCATRRLVVSPAQLGGTRREVPGSDGLPNVERLIGDKSMPGNQWPGSGVRDGALGDPRDMAKAGLPESQSPGDGSSHPPERHLKPVPALRCPVEIGSSQPSGPGAMPSEGIEGDEWGAYVTLVRMTRTNVGSPTGRES